MSNVSFDNQTKRSDFADSVRPEPLGSQLKAELLMDEGSSGREGMKPE
ncbi:MAG: hypothetical protein JSU72_04400 [Deltaproteobacteria bacterium]|nr:MAG: hypothetical protein JSU72_04400 [Deltaproteobacteria bacterium]